MSTNLLTQRRVLRTGSPLWSDSRGASVTQQPLTRDLRTEIAVIGTGISGALVAFTLTQRGYRVILLDRREPLHGSSMASTALVQPELDVSLTELTRRIGANKARRAWHRSWRAVRALKELIRREAIRCELRAQRSLYLAGNAYGARALQAESQLRARADLPGTFIDHAALARRFGIDRTGAIVSGGSAALDPVQLTAGVLRRAHRAGARVYAPADVIDVASHRHGVELFTREGHTIAADHVVFCTGYELPKALPLDGHTIKSTWAIATHPVSPLPPWLTSTVVWEASDPYLYLRTTADGRIVAGGEDEASATAHTDRGRLTTKSHAILAQVHALLPTVQPVLSHRWAGAFGESPTGLPIIDHLPRTPRCHVVLGFGGNGFTHSMIAAHLTADAIDGRRHPDAPLYRAPR